MKFRLLTILLLCLPLMAQQYSVQYNSTSKRIVAPTNILGMTFGNQLITNFVGTGLQNSSGNLAVDGSLYNLYLNPNIYQATNGNLTLLQAYGPTTWQATNANLTLLSAYGPTTWQSTNANLTALAGNPNLYQATNTVLTTLAGLGPNTWQATNASLTALANNPQLYQATNGTLTRLGGIGAGVSGDVLYRDATGWTNLAKGIDGKVLKLTGGFPSWETDSTGVGATGDDVWVNHTDVTNPNFTNAAAAEITWSNADTNWYPVLAAAVTRDTEVATWITVSTNLVPSLSLGGFAGQDAKLTNSFLMSAMTASRLAIFDGSKYLTNSTLTEASITDNLTEAEASALYEATNNAAINRIKNIPTTANYLLQTDGTGITNKAVGGDLSFSGGNFTIGADAVALTTDTTGDYVATAAGTTAEVEVSGAGTEGRAITIGLPDDLVLGDASFTAITNSGALTSASGTITNGLTVGSLSVSGASTGTLLLGDADGNHYGGMVPNATTTTDTILNLPAAPVAGLVSASVSGVTNWVLTAIALDTYQATSTVLTTWASINPGANVGTFLATPSSANLRGAVTDESGTGALIFAGGDIGAATATTPGASDNDTSVATTAFVTGSTVTFTGKTFDAAGTGNVLKQTRYLVLQRPDYTDGSGAVLSTNALGVSGLMHATFSGNAETNANWAVYEFPCPADLDTGVAMTATFAFLSGGTDADDYVFHLTYGQVAAGTAYPTGTSIASLPIVMTVTPTTPASGDLQTSAATTLTGWAAALTPGAPMAVRVARLQNGQDDSARCVSLRIAYGSTQ